jgi:beta-lactamase regulating signal transducer with metallopeptidase domain
MTLVVESGALAKLWLATLAMTAAQGTLLALIAYAVTRGRLRPAWHAAVWLVVVAKLALPWSPGLPWSLADLIARFSGGGGDAPAAIVPAALQPAAPAASSWSALAWLALAGVWAIGVAIVLGRALAAHRRVTLAARRAPAAPDTARALLAELAAGVRARGPSLVLGGPDQGPHVVGLGVGRTIIVIPPALLERPELLRAALLHELAHVRRHDGLARVVQIVATAMCWFWPVARIAGRRLDLAREAACDAWALEMSSLSRPAYARLLVQMAGLRGVAAPALATPHALDARVAAVLGPPVRARNTRLAKLVLAGVAVLALGGARTAAARGEVTCSYTPQLAETLFLAHPEADVDGDGTLSRDEACELQAELRRHADELASTLDPSAEAELESLLDQPLCCNCDRGDGVIGPLEQPAAACHQVEGVE